MFSDIGQLYVIAGLGALAASLVLTPVVRRLAARLGFVDRPDGRRKTHATAVALGGGAAVFAAAMIAIVAVAGTAHWMGLSVVGAHSGQRLIVLGLAAVLIVVLGLFDDLLGMRGRHKLLGQVVVATLIVGSGLRIEGFTVFGYTVNLGFLAIPCTLFWLLGTTNAINLIDGIDGLASSVGMVLCLTMAAINGYQGFVLETAIMLALAGALLGFLRYNFAPASIYLGDAGSMLVGLLIGTVAVATTAKGSVAMAFSVPLAVWAIPILDSVAAFVRRKLTGRSFFTADRGHLHHSLLVRGWSVRQATMFITLICATTCFSAVLSLYAKNEWIALVTIVAVLGFLVVTRTFGHVEFELVSERVRGLASRLGSHPKSGESGLESRVRLQGSREWEKLWSALVESAEGFRLKRLRLSINIPAIHESFYATWEAKKGADVPGEREWKISQPLIVDGQDVGSIDLCGIAASDGPATSTQLVSVLEFLEPMEDDIRQIREQIQLDKSAMRLGRSDGARSLQPK